MYLLLDELLSIIYNVLSMKCLPVFDCLSCAFNLLPQNHKRLDSIKNIHTTSFMNLNNTAFLHVFMEYYKEITLCGTCAHIRHLHFNV